MRPDKRGNEDIRETKISYDGLARVDGSARFSFGVCATIIYSEGLASHFDIGDTAALASLSAPIEVRLAAELPSKATFEVSIRPLTNVPATESKALAGIIRSSLEPSLILTKNPRSLVQLVVQSLSQARPDIWSTTLAATMINASTLACLNSSSLPMRGIVTAVAAARNRQGFLIADPSNEELEESTGIGCFAFMFSDDIENTGDRSNCIWASWKSTTGGYNEREVFDARELARRKAEEVYKSIRASIAKKFGEEQ